MPERTIVCPSGLAGVVRGLKGREMNLLGNKKAAKSGELFDNLLNACWVQTDDPGPYTLNEKGKLNWLDVLVADRLFTLIQIRQATYPHEEYSFRVTCPRETCEESFAWALDLDDLPVKKVPEAGVESVKTNSPLIATIENTSVCFRLTTGKDERSAVRFLKGQQQKILELLNLRITEIPGVETAKKKAWLEDLEMVYHRDLLAEFDKQDGGIETEIEVECPECGHVFGVELPFGAEFFLPKRR